MILLFVGDVVGAVAAKFLAARIPEMRRRLAADLVVVNAENCAPNGLGQTVELVDLLFASGVDVITGGNHSWDSDDSVAALAHPRVLRPYNVDDAAPGAGVLTIEVRGEPVTVLNLADACAMHGVGAVGGKVRPVYEAFTDAPRAGAVIVDFHGDHVLEKQIFAHAVDGEAAAVLGTHTHEATLPLHIFPGGTAFVTDVGMAGPVGGMQGFAPANLVANLKRTGNAFGGPMPRPIEDAPITVGAVLIEFDGRRAVRIERVGELFG